MKFIVSHRRAGKFRESEKQASREALDSAATMAVRSAHVITDNTPGDDLARRTLLMEGTEAQMNALAVNAPDDVIVEPLIEHHYEKTALGAFAATKVVPADSTFPAGTGLDVNVQVRADGQPLPNSTVTLVVRALDGERMALEAISGNDGFARFSMSLLFQPLFAVAVPYAEFWAVSAPITGGGATIVCPPLPGRQRIDWWHRDTGFPVYDEDAGTGIRVGVIDTGFGPHGHLSGTDEGAFIDNGFDPNGGADIGRHGSHVCGTIAGRPGPALRHAGVAPGVELFSVRVFPPDAGAANNDIANAIDFLSRERQCDLINMSLGAPVPSLIIGDAIQDARERGTLCVCAAANSAGPVEFPAAFDEAVAISAAGKLGEPPAGTVSAAKTPNDPILFGADQLFLANFSCFGPEINAIAPGVGIIATVPERHGLPLPYAALDGTSMASPIATGTLARALAQDAAYLATGRDVTRAAMARFKLQDICRTIGLAPIFQGDGIPFD